jgi:hypothetical protein
MACSVRLSMKNDQSYEQTVVQSGAARSGITEAFDGPFRLNAVVPLRCKLTLLLLSSELDMKKSETPVYIRQLNAVSFLGHEKIAKSLYTTVCLFGHRLPFYDFREHHANRFRAGACGGLASD